MKICFIAEGNFLLKLYPRVMEKARYLFGTSSTNRYKSIYAIASPKFLESRQKHKIYLLLATNYIQVPTCLSSALYYKLLKTRLLLTSKHSS